MSRIEETYVNNSCDKETELLPKNSGPLGWAERLNWFRSAAENLLHRGEGLQKCYCCPTCKELPKKRRGLGDWKEGLSEHLLG